LTIREVAALAGVSTATVSKVINNKSESISKETREKVLAVIEEHNYVPFQKVSERVSSSSSVVALLVSDVSDIFCSELLRGVEDYFFEKELNVIACSIGSDAKKEKRYLHMLKKQSVRGVIRFPNTPGEDDELDLELADICSVVLDDAVRSPNALKTMFNNSEGGRIAASHLIGLGHRRIGYICPKTDKPYLLKRFEGYLQALADSGMEADERLVFWSSSTDRKQSGYEGAKYLLSQQASAIFCSDDHVAAGAYKAVFENRLRIPEDISVIGFDDSMLCELLEPNLASVRQSAYEIGQQSANLLYLKITGASIENTVVCVQPQLVSRESAAAPGGAGAFVPKVCAVIGSITAEVKVQLSGLSLAGTHEAQSVEITPGGAAVKKGLELKEKGFIVYLVGCLGNDSHGHSLFQELGAAGFRTDGIHFQDGLPTLIDLSSTSADGSKSVVHCPGASLNGQLIEDCKWIFSKADTCWCEKPYVEDLKQRLAGEKLSVQEF
jgi:DNA-binding LacI/PurR family transcriptional regulator